MGPQTPQTPQTPKSGVRGYAEYTPQTPHSPIGDAECGVRINIFSREVGYNDAVLTVGGANTQEIGDYDQALDMTQIMDDSDRKLVWAVAHSAARRTRGPAWTKIGKLTGMHAQTVKRRFEQAIMELWYKI